MTSTLGEPLKFDTPGWMVDTDRYTVLCWAPGAIGRHHDQWSILVKIGDEDDPSATLSEIAFGDTLTSVLPALRLLELAGYTSHEIRSIANVLILQLVPEAE